jgi:uncharacterized protein
MAPKKFTKLRRLNVATHRDLGYFFSTLIVVYCLSGIALNHVNDWNPDFVIDKKEVKIDPSFTGAVMDKPLILQLGKLVGEQGYKVYDVPTKGQVKIYYDNASFHVNFDRHSGLYERVARRAVFYQSNLFHRNSIKGWRWFADVFAVLLIVLNVTGLFVLKGKHGIGGRGKWLIAAGLLPPVVFFIINVIK